MIPGAWLKNSACEFNLWAPLKKSAELLITRGDSRASYPMRKTGEYFTVSLDSINPGERYMFSADGDDPRPDPASHSQPDGVHAASAVVDHSAFRWSDRGWKGINMKDMIIYEMHTGTFTPGGTFETAAEQLGRLKKTGINTIEIMPVAQFPGKKNWGYDGAYIFAPQNSYGGPEGLKKFVNTCHKEGFSVILDVVYNHLGPEGNYSGVFGPYYTDKYRTPWGSAMNFDGPYSDGVRDFVVSNALYWLEHYHMDGLRLDAVHAIYDFSAKHILAEIKEKSAELSRKTGRKYMIIAESDLNDPKLVTDKKAGGYGLDSQWADDMHHSLHAFLTGERDGYYADFGGIESIHKSLLTPFVVDGGYSGYRKRKHGADARGLSGEKFVVFSQNHDQTGNRFAGERLTAIAGEDAAKLAAAFVLLSPYVPMIFMGEEYGERAPFLYFIDHGDPGLIEAVREGRRREFEGFMGGAKPPDPASEETFRRCILKPETYGGGFLEYYAKLALIRKKHAGCGASYRAALKGKLLEVSITKKSSRILCLYNFGREAVRAAVPAGGTVLLSAGAHERGRLTVPGLSAAVIKRGKK